MSRLPLFEPEEEPLPPQAARLAPKLQALAAQGVYFGTSSWKYEGWLGSIYTREKYMVRGKFSAKAFESHCLTEYAAVFPIVCGDFSFYQFPSPAYWQRLFQQTPGSFQFGLKVPEEITVAHWPNHPRYGSRAGTRNAGFLDAHMLQRLFLRPLDAYRDRVAVLILEFGTFPKSVFATAGAFLDRLGPFLSALPAGFRYAVEIRNPEYLGPAYFACLREHGVAHVFNAWTRMPELTDQIRLPEAFSAEFSVARALLRHGRSYEDAVRRFGAYESVQEPYPPTRDALRQLAERARQTRQPAFLFVNNRLEGNSPGTIEAVVASLQDEA